MKRIISLLCAVVLLFSLCSCSFDEPNKLSFFAMDTLMEFTLYGVSAKESDEVSAELQEKTATLEKLFSVNVESSDVSKINSASGEVSVSDDTLSVIKSALSVSKITDGAFDITVYPLVKLWGFDNGNYGVPKDSDIKDALKTVGCKSLELDGNNVTNNGGGITLGGIAKGYLGDELIKLLNSRGVAAVCSLGGNIALAGNNPDGGSWKVAVRDPYDVSKKLCVFETPGNVSVVTSGAYERYFEYEGKKYHHILNPKTGFPADSDIVSVTVIGENGTVCDAFSTALFVMGSKKATAFMSEHSDFKYIILTEDNSIYTSGDLLNLTLTDSEKYTLK